MLDLKDYLSELINRATSGNCDDTEILDKNREDVMSCKDVYAIIGAFWIAIEEMYNTDKDEVQLLISKIVQNIVENM